MASLKKANKLFKEKRYQDAVECYQAAIVENPELKSYINFNMQVAKKRIGKEGVAEDSKPWLTTLPFEGNKAEHVRSDCLHSGGILEYYDKTHPAAPYLLNCQLYTVDVIIPVYNALEDVKNCLRSLDVNTDQFRVNAIIVNDKSDEVTTGWLREFCAGKPLFTLIEHPENRGYTKAINTGLSRSQADYVVTLNSDTIVTKGWLEGLVRCIRSDQKLGIVGPLSNAASWQNVPDLLDENKQFAVNDIPLDMTPDEMAELVCDASHHTYPRVPFVNGFCFMMSREVIDSIGLLDEVAFPTGYGEENDYCIRAADAGFELAVADDAYVFHAKSKSFGHEQRKELSSKGSKNLKEKHTDEKVKKLISKVKDAKNIDSVRTRIKVKVEDRVVAGKEAATTEKITLKYNNISILFLLPVQGGGGGAHSVVQEVHAMRRIGFNVRIAMKHAQVSKFLRDYDDIPDSKDMFVGFSEDSLINLAERYDAVIATLFSSVGYLKKIVDSNPHILPGYYIQDYEPLFFEEGTDRWSEAYRSYNLIPNAFFFAKTHWIINKVRDVHGIEVQKVSPSIDHDVYKITDGSRGNNKIKISAMVRPKTPRRGAARTMRVLSEIYKNNPSDVEIEIFGCENDDPDFKKLLLDFKFVNHGVLKRRQVAKVLSDSDIFIDLSDYQAFGRTGLEAMACGTVSVLPKIGGAHEYASHNQNALLVDPFNESSCFKEINSLVRSGKVLHEMQDNATLTAADYSVHKAAVSELVPLVSRFAELRSCTPKIDKKKLLIFPSLQKDRFTPTGSAYVRLLLPYQVPQVLKWNHVETVKSLPDPNDYNDCTIIMQRDVPAASFLGIKKWIKEWRGKGNKVIYDLDDDLLALEHFQDKGNFDSDVPDKIRFLASSADLVTVSTYNLKEKLKRYAKNVSVVENCVDKEIWGLQSERDHSVGDFRRFPGRPVTIGYIGTPSHIDDVKIVESALLKIQDKYGDKVEIEAIGVFQDTVPTFGKRVGLPKKRDYPNFVGWLQKRVHWDIGVIPLEDSEFNKSKSFLKFLEYSSLNMAIVVSDHPAYSDVARNDENCLVSSNSMESWVENISRLIEDQLFREELSRNAFNECRERFVLDERYASTFDVLEQVSSLKASAVA